MLQIRLSKGSSGDGGGGAAVKPPPTAETVTVACPDHLIIADLPVAKSVGAASSSAVLRTVGRRSRRHLGERVHFCLRCDLPISIYGRLIPCGHVFCLACARSDASCYNCDERIQKIQSIKMMEGIYICAAPQCYKSFLKRSEWESHILDTHSNLIQSNKEKEGENEKDGRASSIDTQKQSILQEMSTARAPPRSGFSPSSNSQLQDREDRTRHHQSNDQLPPKMSVQPMAPSYHGSHQQQVSDSQPNITPQGFERSNSYTHVPQTFENQSGPGPQQSPLNKPTGPLQSSNPDFSSMQPPQPPNYPFPGNPNQVQVPPPNLGYPQFPSEGPHQYLSAAYEMPRPDMMPVGGTAQGSLLGYPPAQTGMANFINVPRGWVGLVGVPFDPSLVLTQGIPGNLMNPADIQGRFPSLQGEIGQLPGGLLPNYSQIGQASELQGVNNDDKGVLAQLPQSSMPVQLPPPPPLPLPMSQQLNPGIFPAFGAASQEGQGYMTQR